MKELTVIELSEQTGLTRSQIYHLNKAHNLINLNKKMIVVIALIFIVLIVIIKFFTKKKSAKHKK